MKIKFLIAALLVFTVGHSQNNDDKIKILQNLFTSNEIKNLRGQKIFETKLYESYASIPIKDCRFIDFGDSISAMAFNIYLSDDPDQYIFMIKEGIKNMDDITEYTLFQGGGERLMQVIFYDMKNNKFPGNGDNFLIRNLSWIPSGLGDLTEIFEMNCFDNIKTSDHTCILNIIQCPDCLGGLHYVFKYQNGNILTSSAVDGCFENVVQDGNKLYINMITNCYEYEYDGETPRIEKNLLFGW